MQQLQMRSGVYLRAVHIVTFRRPALSEVIGRYRAGRTINLFRQLDDSRACKCIKSTAGLRLHGLNDKDDDDDDGCGSARQQQQQQLRIELFFQSSAPDHDAAAAAVINCENSGVNGSPSLPSCHIARLAICSITALPTYSPADVSDENEMRLQGWYM